MLFKTLDLDLTERCNFACDYCYKHDKNNERLTEEMGKKILTWFFEQNKVDELSVNCLGGEPLLELNLLCMLIDWTKSVRKRPVKWGVTSNLSLLTEAVAGTLKLYDINVHCSIDGVKEAHDAHRKKKNGEGTWLSVIKAVPLALKVSPYDTGRYSVHPDSVQYMHEGILNILGMGFRSVAPVPVFCSDGWTETTISEMYKQMGLTAEWFMSMCRTGQTNLSVKWIRDGLRRLLNPRIQFSACGAARGMISADVRGNLWPCHRYTGVDRPKDAMHLGNVTDGIIEERRTTFLESDIPKICISCENVFLCASRCAAERWSTYNDLTKPLPVACQFSGFVRKWVTYIHAVLSSEKCKPYLDRYLPNVTKRNRSSSKQSQSSLKRNQRQRSRSDCKPIQNK